MGGIACGAALVIGALFNWRWGLAIIGQVFSTRSGVEYGILAFLGTAYAVAAARVRSLEYVAIGLVVLAVALEALERRRNRIAAGVSDIHVISRE